MIGKFAEKAYRTSYVAHYVASSIANQMRALRGDRSQTVFGEILDKPQSVISRLEDEGYGRVNVQTLIDIARKLDLALFVRFVDYDTFLELADRFEKDEIAPTGYDQEALLRLADKIRRESISRGIHEI